MMSNTDIAPWVPWIGGKAGGRSTHGICLGAHSWLVREGHADSVSRAGLGVVLVLRYYDDEPGSPWDHRLFVDECGDGKQREALEAIFLGRAGGSTVDPAPTTSSWGRRTGCVIFMTGARVGWPEKGIVYPRSELARRHGAGAEAETSLPAEAYAPFPTWGPGLPETWDGLPGP